MNIQRGLAFGLVLLLLVSSFAFAVGEVFSNEVNGTEQEIILEGSGTPGDPYMIYDVYDLQNMSANLTAHYALANDIDANETSGWNDGAGFEPVGYDFNKFTGSLNGKNYTITGLYINRTSTNYVGLFKYVDSGGEIRNVGVLDAYISGDDYVGGLVGRNYEGTVNNSYAIGNVSGDYDVGGLLGWNTGTVSNSYATGNVSGYKYVGGLLGWNRGTVENSSTTGNVSGDYEVGGLMGRNEGAVSNSSATGDVNGDDYVGALAGENEGTVSNSYATGEVSGYEYVGGLAGENEGTVSNSYATGTVSGYEYVGGLVGSNGDTILNSSATGNVSGQNHVGGLVGRNSGTVSNSYATGNVSGNDYIGGLVGPNFATVEDSYATGTVSGYEYVGGLLGYSEGTVSNSYARGNVSGNYYVGGFVGWSYYGTVSNSYARGNVTRLSGSTNSTFGGFVGYNRGKIINCYSTGAVNYEGTDDPTDKGFVGAVEMGGYYEMTGNFWDVETSGQNSTSGNATGKTTAEMKTQSTFTDAGWDFDNTWHMIENITYPLLQWQDLPEAASMQVDLFAYDGSDGWNFVSFNIDLADTSIENILADIDGSYDRLMYYCAAEDEWKTYVPGRAVHYNDLHSWDKTMGIWIKMNNNETLNVEGYAPTNTDITLYPGWNMVGLPSESAGNHGLPEEVSKIGYFDAAEEYNVAYDYHPANYTFEPGNGYLLYNDADYSVVWTVDY